jgi:two-component system, NarL family, sensor histidine kinase DevS
MPYRSIDDPAKLRRLLQSVFLLQADLSLPVLLRHIVEEACAMAGARYGALGVLDEDRTALAEFITVGVDPAVERAIGNRPTGEGILGLLITQPQPLRLADLHRHPDSVGFPPGHPPMTSFLGVPITARGEVYGNLYLTDKIGWAEFTQDDELLVIALAQAAGIAVENARLHQRVQDIAVFEDRDRIARDLHDAVIQRLFAVGLSLQAVANAADPKQGARISRAVADLDETIRQIRSAIFELTSPGDDQGVRAAVLALVHELQEVTGFEVPVSFDGPVDTAVDAGTAEHLLFTVREALSNVARHAGAGGASITVAVHGDQVTLRVVDDGRGLGPAREGGLGLQNMRRRAEKLAGELVLEAGPGGHGTALTWRVRIGA